MTGALVIETATEHDVPTILEIYNEAIENTVAVWDLEPQTLATRLDWFHSLRSGGYPILVARNPSQFDSSPVLGSSWLSSFRPKAGFRQTAEISIYVSPKARGLGIGKALLRATLQEAEKMGLHIVIAGMDSGNELSLRMHEKEGFVETGRLKQVGRKFGRWLDLVYMQYEVPGKVE